MSQRDHTRSCPSCERELSGREHFGEGGLSVIWKCVCGWASARTIAIGGEASSMLGGASPASKRLGAAPVGYAPRVRQSSGVRAKPDAPEEPNANEADPSQGRTSRKNDG
ncbi:MAG: hypothetical protein QM778_19475 [Myxococcales bacterium]